MVPINYKQSLLLCVCMSLLHHYCLLLPLYISMHNVILSNTAPQRTFSSHIIDRLTNLQMLQLQKPYGIVFFNSDDVHDVLIGMHQFEPESLIASLLFCPFVLPFEPRPKCQIKSTMAVAG